MISSKVQHITCYCVSGATYFNNKHKLFISFYLLRYFTNRMTVILLTAIWRRVCVCVCCQSKWISICMFITYIFNAHCTHYALFLMVKRICIANTLPVHSSKHSSLCVLCSNSYEKFMYHSYSITFIILIRCVGVCRICVCLVSNQ